jgi:hypothetical protein
MLTAPRSFKPSQGIAASECLPKGCRPPSNVLLKDFARWYTKSLTGRLDPEPNDVSVRNTLKKFYSEFERVTGTAISQELRNDVYFVSLRLEMKCCSKAQPY